MFVVTLPATLIHRIPSTRCIDLASFQIKSPSIAVFEHDRVSRAIGLIAATRVHRVFVVDTEKSYRPIRVISITDILKYLLE